MQHTTIKNILSTNLVNQTVCIKGWVRTFRNNTFIAINDGSCVQQLQAVINTDKITESILKQITPGACVAVTGRVIPSLGKGQSVEIEVQDIEIYGTAESDIDKPHFYPLQPKAHSLEYLREIGHLRFRTNTFGAIYRIRHTLAFAIHEFFHQKDFLYIHAPMITSSDAEGAGEMFTVTTLDFKNLPKTPTGAINYQEDFFGKETKLTVSGQLEAELAALALGNVYTFGPTFRAENSNTTRHLAEFWMIEPEMAFYNLQDNMALVEELLKYVIQVALTKNADDLAFLSDRLTKEEAAKPQADRSAMNLIDKLNFCLKENFEKLSYTQAIEILKEESLNKKNKFQFKIDKWGADLQSEHERFLVEKHFKKPIILTDYPKEIKSFYMRQNDDGKTVAAMDVLFPGIGEIVGGSQREERLDKLTQRMNELNISTHEMSWYLDTRRFGTCPHAGFGLGFERLVLFVTGMTNIRDVIPFPRTPKNCEF